VNGRPLEYPASSHASPVLIDPADVAPIPLDAAACGAVRVTEKPLGRFPHHRTAVRLLEIGAGGRFQLRGRAVILFLSGTGAVAGRAFRERTACCLEDGESAELTADTVSCLLEFELPTFS
jgi:hypothetical protein